MTLLSVRNLIVEYGTERGPVLAVDGATLDIPRGSITGLVGESGCGKSTLGRALMGVLPAHASVAAGSIYFDGQDLTTLRPSDRRALLWRRLAFIPQTAMNALDPVQRLRRQLREVLQDRGGLSRPEADRRAVELFDLVGLAPARLDDFPHQFSGGMRQRASIALALALYRNNPAEEPPPALIIADEPVTALDVIVQRQILDVLRGLQSRLGLSLLLVTHDIAVVAYACDRIAVMYAGRIVETGPAAAVLETPLHPYTMGLTRAFPDIHGDIATLVPIGGAPPSLLDPPPGCRFAPRCPFALHRCHLELPSMTGPAGHAAACWRAPEAEILRPAAAQPKTWAA